METWTLWVSKSLKMFSHYIVLNKKHVRKTTSTKSQIKFLFPKHCSGVNTDWFLWLQAILPVLLTENNSLLSLEGIFLGVAILPAFLTCSCFPNHVSSAPTIEFEEAAYQVREPSGPDATAIPSIKVIRRGDQNRTSKIRCSTRDGSAQSGVDYYPKSRVLKFNPGNWMLIPPADFTY